MANEEYPKGFPTRYFEVEIVSCADEDYWYKDMIGQRIKVQKHHPSAWGFVEKKTGGQVYTHDIRSVGDVPVPARGYINPLQP